MISQELAALFARDLRRLIQQIEAFPDTASLWQTVPGMTNAAGTLALHLEGNLREYVGRQLGGTPFERNRPLEFSARGVERAELLERVAVVAREIPPMVAQLSAERLAADYPEQVLGRPMSTHQFLVHLSGHFNYHLGQIDCLRRALTGNGAITLAGLA